MAIIRLPMNNQLVSFRYAWLTTPAVSMPIMGNKNRGKNAVTASGKTSVIQ